jgi:hypothetical protein
LVDPAASRFIDPDGSVAARVSGAQHCASPFLVNLPLHQNHLDPARFTIPKPGEFWLLA